MRSFFVASTGQNIGKTTICLGLVSLLQKKGIKVGFLKPVGQQHIDTKRDGKVDKDVLLFKSHFDLQDPLSDMSPVLFPRGFTRDFLDGKIEKSEMESAIYRCFKKIQSNSPSVIVEGTGHVGVGSIVGLNNAGVAKMLNLPILLIASGGLGSSIDELSLNFSLCEKLKVPIAGVIVNRVLREKREMLEKYFPLALKRWDIPLIGMIPYSPLLSAPTMRDFEILFQSEMLSGSEYGSRAFENIRIAATTLELFRTKILPKQLIITPAGREDILLAILTKFWDRKIAKPQEELAVGLILTGKRAPNESMIHQIKKAKIPMLYVPLSSFAVMKMINGFTSKIRGDDRAKILEALRVVESHIDFGVLQKALERSMT